MRVIIKSIFWIFAKILYRVKVVGKENFPKEGAIIVCPNHVHALDSALVIATAKRKVNVLAKEDLFKSAIGRWFAKLFGIYPLKRNVADIEAIKISLKLLKNKEPLMIFPEGTRNGLRDGKPIKNGPIMLAIKSGALILPIGIQGNFKVFSKVIINIGKPINYSQYKDKTKDKEFISNLTKELMQKIVELRDEKTKKDRRLNNEQ